MQPRARWRVLRKTENSLLLKSKATQVAAANVGCFVEGELVSLCVDESVGLYPTLPSHFPKVGLNSTESCFNRLSI